jgi:spermidine synthase
MASLAPSFERQGAARGVSSALFIATVFTGSFLLFLMQPMVARMALPRLGGAPAVWNSAMLVYQALLLGGYSYAHFAGRLRPRVQGRLHLALFAFAALWLPLGLMGITPPADASPILWVPWLLAGSIGPLFFVVSAQAPLMQRWFALREPGANPYALYAASNLGSFGGLLAYPLVVEPFLPLGAQTLGWSLGYGGLLALIAVCVLLLPERAAAVAKAVTDTPAPTMTQRLRWIALAAVPSGLILAATTHITTDILAMPLIWVVPLGLYLLSFTFAFADKSRVARICTWAFPLVLIVAGAAAGSGEVGNLWLSMAGDLLVVFVGSVALHRRMYDLRPAPARLTDFYLCMSIGGVVGGLFCGLIAPALFDWLYEYPLLILAAALLTPLRDDAAALSPRMVRWVPVAAMLLSLYAGGLFGGATPPASLMTASMIAVAFLACFAMGSRAVFTICLAALILGLGCWGNIVRSIDHHTRTRSYFGIYTVGENGSGPGRARILVHGTTTHGIQLLDPHGATYPTSYYAYGSGIGTAMRAAGPKARIGIVGLGAGTLACYAKPTQDWRFYEIDPAIARIARDTRNFTFLSRCLPHVPIEIGDARLTLATTASASRDILAVDAFSSDAIPMHLLTREAFAGYARVIGRDGLLMVHISNHYVDLQPILAAEAALDGWHAQVLDYRPDADAAAHRAAPSVWVAMSKSPATIARLRASDPKAQWRQLATRSGTAAWTDDYGSILPLLKGF